MSRMRKRTKLWGPLLLLKSGEFYQKSYLRVAPGSIAEKEPSWLLSGLAGAVTQTSDPSR